MSDQWQFMKGGSPMPIEMKSFRNGEIGQGEMENIAKLQKLEAPTLEGTRYPSSCTLCHTSPTLVAQVVVHAVACKPWYVQLRQIESSLQSLERHC